MFSFFLLLAFSSCEAPAPSEIVICTLSPERHNYTISSHPCHALSQLSTSAAYTSTYAYTSTSTYAYTYIYAYTYTYTYTYTYIYTYTYTYTYTYIYT